MNAPLRKGWCPGALRPMAARDGMIVRLRITGGILAADTAAAIADLSRRFGNEQIDLSARANLQLRGIEERALPALWDALTTLGLLDADPAAEAIRNVLASPLAGCHDGIDLCPITEALERRLIEDTALHTLPAKMLFLLDDDSEPSLAGVAADIRFDWSAREASFSIGLGGTANDALRIGSCDGDGLPARAAAVARGIIALQHQAPDARRIRDLVRDVGAETVVEACGGSLSHDSKIRSPQRTDAVVGLRTFGGLPTLGLAVPFGRLTARMLAGGADCAMSAPRRELRLTPWRTLLVPGATTLPDLGGFITDAADSRLAVAACVGREGCAQGTTATQVDAADLAESMAVDGDGGIKLHVSGCAKGCARPDVTPITLVGRDGLYDVVRDGRAGDAPIHRGLDLTAVRALLAAATA